MSAFVHKELVEKKEVEVDKYLLTYIVNACAEKIGDCFEKEVFFEIKIKDLTRNGLFVQTFEIILLNLLKNAAENAFV